MAAAKNINWEISLLEAKTGEGSSSWKALAKEAKRKRVEEKKGKLSTGATTKLKTPNDDSDTVETQQEKLRRLRIEKAQRALHQRRRIFHSIIKTIASLEKQKRLRRVKKAKALLESSDTNEKDMEEAKATISENTEILENVQKIKVDDLVECMVLKFYKGSPVVREAFGEYECEPHIKSLSDDKTAMRMLNDIKAVNVIKAAVLAVEALIEGSNTKEAKNLAKEKTKQMKKSKKELSKQEALKNKSVGQADNEDTSAKSTFVASLGDFDSDDYDDDDDDIDTAKPNKRKVVDGDYSDDEKDFNAIYGINERRNRPGQRARRQKYENMYGDEANHIKLKRKDKKPKQSFNHTDTNIDNNRKKIYVSPRQERQKSNTQDEKLHPSWEAKKKQKEIMEQALNTKGTKIIFD
ncbi:hypothetical protein LPJ72_000449 [Coemansia sp. Benny D160-2]|nr:hypothetical protein LPJ72_000449 [Coemansia sp. Benny D160-2]